MENDLIDSYVEPENNSSGNVNGIDVSKAADASIDRNTSVLDDREVSLYRDALSIKMPASSAYPRLLDIVNPSLSSPIRLFSPIDLPRPIIIKKPSSATKE